MPFICPCHASWHLKYDGGLNFTPRSRYGTMVRGVRTELWLFLNLVELPEVFLLLRCLFAEVQVLGRMVAGVR